MKFIWIFLALCVLGGTAHANDNYPEIEWKTTFNVEAGVYVKSAHVLNGRQIRIVVQTYKATKQKFFKYWDMDRKECRMNPLTVVIVKSHYELDDREKFPNENVYADKPGEGSDIIFGRYYKLLDKLYIVPVFTEKYFWRANFSHEILHYLFDECEIKFTNMDEEHEVIDDFLKVHRKIFY